MPQRTGSKHFHIPEKFLNRKTLSYEAEDAQRDAKLKVWVSKYQRCDTEFKHLACIRQGDSVWPTAGFERGGAQWHLHVFFISSVATAPTLINTSTNYQPPTRVTNYSQKYNRKSCASWRVLTLEWLTKIATKILNTIWKLRRSFGPTSNDSNLNWIFTV